MIQTLAPDRTDEALGKRILPGAVRRGRDFTDPHALDSLAEGLPVDAVAIAEEIGWGGVVWESVDELLGGPCGGRMLGHVEVEDAPTVVGEHDQDEEDAEASGGHGEEIDRDQVTDMIGEKSSPSLGWRGASLRKQARDRPLSHVYAELRELAMDSRGAPEWVRGGHAGDQDSDLGVSPPAPPAVARLSSSVQYSRKRRRCHRRTVSGVTITRGCLHRAQTLASPTQKRRSVVRSLGRVTVRL